VYAIKGVLDGRTFVLSEPYSDEQVVTPVLREIVGKSGTLEFDINLCQIMMILLCIRHT